MKKYQMPFVPAFYQVDQEQMMKESQQILEFC